MHGPGQTSSIFRLWTCHRSRKSDKWRKYLMLTPLPSRQPACYWELATRFMGNKEKHHYVCPWRLLFKSLDHFRGFSPTLFLPFVLSHSFSLHEARCTFTLMRLPLLTVIESEWQRLQPFIQMGRQRSRMCWSLLLYSTFTLCNLERMCCNLRK